MKNIKIFTAFILVLFGANVIAASSNVKLESANTDISDYDSLKRGAKHFMNYCSGCHSIELMRYNRIGQDLGMSEDEVVSDLLYAGSKTGEKMKSAISTSASTKWFGGTPPDLSLTSRSRGVDWIYSYLKGFYPDAERTFGVNNHVLANASMPDVLWSLRQSKSAEAFDQDVRDITNFLDYVGEPAKLVRVDLGIKVMLFLAVLLVLSYLLKKEYWKDVKYGKWKAK